MNEYEYRLPYTPDEFDFKLFIYFSFYYECKKRIQMEKVCAKILVYMQIIRIA